MAAKRKGKGKRAGKKSAPKKRAQSRIRKVVDCTTTVSQLGHWTEREIRQVIKACRRKP